ncbi:MAG: hypothetical protein ACYDDF_12855 [Thermoplasmatota archaeon]
MPQWILQVIANPPQNALLRVLAEAGHPLRYSEARRAIDAHPQEFQRALRALENRALVVLRAPVRPDDRRKPRGERRHVVFLELSVLGDLVADLSTEFGKAFQGVTQAHHVPPALLVSPSA